MAANGATSLLSGLSSPLAALANPFSLGGWHWVGFYFAMRLALLVAVEGAVFAACRLLQPLPSRTGAAKPYQHQIGWKDMLYVFANSFIEFGFAQQLLLFVWHSPLVGRTPTALGPVCTLGAL